MRVTIKGQVTIPKAIREKLGIQTHTDIEFIEEADKVYIRASRQRDGRPDRFDRVRGSATVKMTTEEILRLTRGET
jgi:antitoxin PrlF